MGVNEFLEGHSDPIVIKIKVNREIENLNDVKQFIDALNQIDKFHRVIFPQIWEDYYPEYRRRRTHKLISLNINSPPEFSIFTDPAWLAVFITFVASYKQLKENAPEIVSDISEIVEDLTHNISGLSLRQLELLRMTIVLTLEQTRNQIKHSFLNTTNNLQRIGRKLIGSHKGDIEIKVKSIED